MASPSRNARYIDSKKRGMKTMDENTTSNQINAAVNAVVEASVAKLKDFGVKTIVMGVESPNGVMSRLIIGGHFMYDNMKKEAENERSDAEGMGTARGSGGDQG
jgi:hypothetical protein